MAYLFHIQHVSIEDDMKMCLIWYEPNYDMYQGAVLVDGNVRIVQFSNCKEFSTNFIARPILMGLSFNTVSRLYDLLVTKKSMWNSKIREHEIIAFLCSMGRHLLDLRRHWKEHAYHLDWIEETSRIEFQNPDNCHQDPACLAGLQGHREAEED